ncbi:MAG: conjugative transfer signal peptidase TraF [Alphaproteobacteria bacterium 41-28]|nr:MAG: conjugative transfer signal peptidase TraF [Alphaproteobacteria bacterium 41-28]
MNRMLKPITVSVAVAGTVILVLIAVFTIAGARINTTKSIPVGLYWTSPIEKIQKGAYVIFCPPQNSVFDEAKTRDYIGAGTCPGGYGLMMKRVLAAQNDVVSINDKGVYVNGKLLPHSTPIKADTIGRPLPCYTVDHYALSKTELLLMSDVNATSFDGRYFGPIDRSHIKTVIFPVMTW